MGGVVVGVWGGLWLWVLSGEVGGRLWKGCLSDSKWGGTVCGGLYEDQGRCWIDTAIECR